MELKHLKEFIIYGLEKRASLNCKNSQDTWNFLTKNLNLKSSDIKRWIINLKDVENENKEQHINETYFMGIEVSENKEVFHNYKKFTILENDYLVIEVNNDNFMDEFNNMNNFMLYYLDYELNGNILNYYDLDNDKNYIYFPVKKHYYKVSNELTTSKISYCGLHCGFCFLHKCGGCKTNKNYCSYATLFEDKICPNMRCCINKNLEGCYLCSELENCRIGFYESDNQNAKACALFIKKEGAEMFEKCLKQMALEKISFNKILDELKTDDKRLAFLYEYLDKVRN